MPASNRQISELIFEFGVRTFPYNTPKLPGFAATRRTRTRTSARFPALPGRVQRNYTIEASGRGLRSCALGFTRRLAETPADDRNEA